MKLKGLRFWFTVGSGAIAHRGEVLWSSEELVRIKVYTETGKRKMVTYLKEKVHFIEKWH